VGAAGVLTVKADMKNAEDCQYLIETAVHRFLSIDVLFLNAGVTAYEKFERMKDL
jgi:NADP-dependent 3-hydroxy acid dehydrogenase YdfG